MDKCERIFVGASLRGLWFIFLILVLLLPLLPTSLVFLGNYLPIIEENDISVQNDKFLRTTTTTTTKRCNATKCVSSTTLTTTTTTAFPSATLASGVTSSLQGTLFKGTAARKLSVTTQVVSVIIPILVYTLRCTKWKIFTRRLLLGLLSVAQTPLLYALYRSVQKIPYYNNLPADLCLLWAAILTPGATLFTSMLIEVILQEILRPFASFVTSLLVEKILQDIRRRRTTASRPSATTVTHAQQTPNHNKKGEAACNKAKQATAVARAQQTPKQNQRWEVARNKAKQDVLDAAAQAAESGDAHFLSLANLTSATFKSTDSRTSLDGVETRTVSEGAMTFHKGLETNGLRSSITGYGNNRDGSFVVVEGQLSVWSGKAYWVTQAPSSKIQTLVTGTFTRSLPHNADTIRFVGSSTFDDNTTGEFNSFTLYPKNEEVYVLPREEPDVEMGVEPSADVASIDASAPSLQEVAAQEDIVCSVRPVESDGGLPTATSLPIAQAEILPAKVKVTVLLKGNK